jgi:long-chain fatty acid transport protein
MGALYWNPAGIGALPASEATFGLGLLLPTSRLASVVPAGSIIPGVFPPVTLSGNDAGEPGVCPIPSAAFVYRDDESPFTYGLGMYGIGGFSVNYPASETNPVLTPPPPNGIGLGHVFAQLEVLQVAPTIAVAVTQNISVGITPTINLARLSVTPLFFSPPDDANGDTFSTYPSGTATRYTWGGGITFGLLYTDPSGINLGASIKSPQWFEKFRAHSADELGAPRVLKTGFDLPMTISVGGAYTGFENWTFALDLRYFDYANTDGFRGSGFNADGSVAGLGWKNIYAVASGVQYQAFERLALRMGYSYNTNPIDESVAFFNLASPLIQQHMLSAGATYEFAPGCLASLSYTHVFENSVTGPIVTPAGEIPGSTVTSFMYADLLIATVGVRF